jgi:ABC-type oligopeptide transport system substrate-binding subunit
VRKRFAFATAAACLGAVLLVASAVGGTSRPAKVGGTMKINLVTDIDYVDPALAYYSVSWELEYATAMKLLNYPDKEAPAGSQLLPEAATGFPKVSADGKSYTFTIRKGIKSNTGETLTAANFAAAINRALNPRMQSPASAFLHDVVGAQDVLDGKSAKASGVTARGQTLTVKLTTVAPDFLARIAMPFFSAIPKKLGIVPEGVNNLASWGPYYVHARTPNRTVELRVNPNYKGNRPHNAAKILYTVGVTQEASLLQIKQGQADYAADGLAPNAYALLGQEFGVNKSQFYVRPLLTFQYLALNNDRPIFKNNLALRKAVNYAIDRPALLRQLGAYAGKRSDQILPPGIPGFKDAALYPLKGADYNTANKLAKGHTGDGKAVLYTCNRTSCISTAQILQFNFKQLGIDLQVKQFARAVQFEKEGIKGEPFDVGYEGWTADYADPFDFINVLLDGSKIHDVNNNNFSYFNDPSYNRKMQAAAKLSGAARYAAYGKLDIDISKNAAPMASWAARNQRIFVSKRVKNFTYNPVYGVDLGALSLG